MRTIIKIIGCITLFILPYYCWKFINQKISNRIRYIIIKKEFISKNNKIKFVKTDEWVLKRFHKEGKKYHTTYAEWKTGFGSTSKHCAKKFVYKEEAEKTLVILKQKDLIFNMPHPSTFEIKTIII